MTFSTINNRISYSFLHQQPIWLDIPAFFKFIKGESKGYCYTVLRDILRNINDDWILTYHRNTGIDYMRFHSYLKAMNIKNSMPKIDKDARNTKFKNSGCSRHARAQALDDLIQMPTKITTALDNFNETTPQINNTLNLVNDIIPDISEAAQRVTRVASRADDILRQLTDMVSVVQQHISTMTQTLTENMQTILTYLIKIVALAYLLQQEQNQSVSNVVALLTLIMPSSVGNCIQQFAAGLIRVIQRISGCNAQEDDDNENDHGFVVSFFSLTVGIVKGLFGQVPKEVYDNLFISNKKVKLIADYIRGTTTIVECVLRLWEKCVELIGDKILKYFNILPGFIKEDTISPLVDEFLAIKQERIDVNATINQESARRVMVLYDKLIKLEAKLVKQLSKSTTHIKILPYLRIMIKSLDTVIARIPDHLRTGLAPRRIKPFWVYIYGDPRIGKTGVFQPYIVNEVARALAINTKYEDYTNYTYLRNCGEDYWEGYDNHSVLWYNDLFQNFADEQAMHKAIMELTNIVDDNVYPLEMAFERKHSVYFSSQLVISNAQDEMINMPFIADKCWSGGVHLYARRNACVHFSLNRKYRSNVGINFIAMQQEMDKNPANCVGYEFCTQKTPAEFKEKLLFPKDLYTLTFTDPITGNVLNKLNFEDGVKYICKMAVNFKNTQSDFKNRLYNHFQSRWEAKAQEDDEFEDAPEMTQADIEAFINSTNAKVIGNMRQVVYDLIGTDDMDLVHAVRQNAQGGIDVINVLYAGNMECEQDMFARATFVIETVGADYWIKRKFSWWQKFKVRCQTLITRVRRKWVDVMMCIFNTPHLNVFIQFVQWTIIGYTYYRVIRLYYGFIEKIFGLYKNRNPQSIMADTPTEQIVNKCKAQTAEGKSLPKRPQILRVKRAAGSAKAMSYDQQNTVVENIVSKQMCKFSIAVKHEGKEVHSRIFGSGLCVGSDIFIMPYHFWYRFKEMQAYWEAHGDEVLFRLHWNEKIVVDVNWDTITTCRLDYKHCEDLIYIRINKLVQKPHIKHFFVRSDDRPNLNELYMFGMRATMYNLSILQVQNGEYVDTVYNHESRDDPLYGGKFEKRQVVVPICLKYYNCTSNVGDCGMLILNCDNKMNNRKIMAMHTAGHVGENYGLGSLIFFEDIDEAFNQLYKDDTPIEAISMAYEEPPEYAQPLKDMGLNVLGRLPRLTVPEYNVDRYPTIMLPRKSKISHSLVYDIMNEDFGPTTMGVARLRPFIDNNGETQYPILKAMKKIAVISNSCSDQELFIIQDHIAETISAWRSPYTPYVLDNDEMINGVGNLNAVEMKTSAGYPYVMLDNSNGKLPFFEKIQESPVKYKMGKYLENCFLQREVEAQHNIITDTYFIDTLKDETRPLEKILLGKTRLFQIGPVDFNLLIRKYFGAFLMHVQSTYIRGEGAVGINANSLEWTGMIKHQLSTGNTFINGDGENFDACASQRIGMSNVESINKWYRHGEDWSSEHDRVRRVLFATFLNSKHIYRDVVYMAWQGNKSGTAITTWFNNLMGMFITRLAIYRKYKTLTAFNIGISPKYYGDDDSIAVNPQIYPEMTCRYYQQVMQSVGIKYTSASKGEVVDTWYPLEEISFLKRKFVFDGEKYLPQLDWQVIIEIARWSESDPTNMVDQLNRFNSSLLEASNYGRSKFKELRTKYVEYCYLLNRQGYAIPLNELFIYEYCEKIKWGEDYSPLQLHYDRATDFDKEVVVRDVGCVCNVKQSNSSDNDDQHSEVLNLIADSQTYEGKQKPARPQVIRIVRPKAQGEEDIEDTRDFDLYLTMLDYLKELQPCIASFTRAFNRAARKPEAKWAFAVLHTKMEMFLRLYRECTELLSLDMAPSAQGEESNIAPVQPKVEPPSAPAPSAHLKTTDSTKDADVQQHGKTTFVDSNAPHQPGVQAMAIPRMFNCNFSHTQENYFDRPLAFDTFVWKSTDAIYAKVGTWAFPDDYYNTYIRNKGAMIAFGRPDIEFTITVNATRFHYGRIMFVIYPFCIGKVVDGARTELVPEAYLQAYNASSWPHWYQLSAGPRQSLKFTVPFRHFQNQISFADSEAESLCWFGIRGFVMAPLSSANGTAAPVEVTLFARFVKPEFAGIIPSEAIAHGEEQELSREGLTVNNPMPPNSSGTLSHTFGAVSAITKDLANYAYSVGMSTPANLSSTNSMQIRQPLLNKCSDLPNAVVLGPTQDASLQTSLQSVNSETDDMNISHIISSPFLLHTYKLTNTITAGTIIYTTPLSPSNMWYTGTGYENPPNAHYPSPLCYVSRFFAYWRGSFKFHFSAICSGFHSARLRIVYQPGSKWVPDGLPTTLSTTSLLRNVVWDINDSSDITVEVPYETITQWCERDSGSSNEFSGRLSVQVINPLTAASDTVNPIYIQCFVWAGDDFQFAKADEKSENFNPDIYVKPKVADAQGEERDPCAIPASSSVCLREQPAIFLGDVDKRQRVYRDHNSNVYTSLKQLTNQLTIFDRFESKAADTSEITAFNYTPYGSGWTDRDYDDNFWVSYLHRIIPMFRFMRGGFRVHVLVNDKIQATAMARRMKSKVYTTPTDQAANDFMNGTGKIRDASFGSAVFYDNSVYPIDFIVPYYSIYANRLTFSDMFKTSQSVPMVASVALSTQKTAKKMLLAVAGADDFMLGYRMGIPRVRFGVRPKLLTHEEPIYFDVAGKQFRLDEKDDVPHPVSVDAQHINYYYYLYKDVGYVWTKNDKKWPTQIADDIITRLKKIHPEKMIIVKRPKRSLFEKIAEGQLTDYTETDSD